MPDRLPDPIADLVRPGASLGRLLATHQLETRRAILEVVGVRAAEAGEYLGVATNASVARRTYAIIIGQQAVAAVTEWISPGHLAAMARAGSATNGASQSLPRADERAPGGRRRFEFVADL